MRFLQNARLRTRNFGRFQDEVIEQCEFSDKMVKINLNCIPFDFKKKAKSQLLGRCYVKICNSTCCDIVNNRADTVQCKAMKRKTDYSAIFSSTGHTQSKKKNEIPEPSSYKIKNYCELLKSLKKKPWKFPAIEYSDSSSSDYEPIQESDYDTEPLP